MGLSFSTLAGSSQVLWKSYRRGLLQRSTAPFIGERRGTTERAMPLARQAVSNLAMNSDPPSTWIAFTGKGISVATLSRKQAAAWAVARLKALATVHLAIGS